MGFNTPAWPQLSTVVNHDLRLQAPHTLKSVGAAFPRNRVELREARVATTRTVLPSSRLRGNLLRCGVAEAVVALVGEVVAIDRNDVAPESALLLASPDEPAREGLLFGYEGVDIERTGRVPANKEKMVVDWVWKQRVVGQ